MVRSKREEPRVACALGEGHPIFGSDKFKESRDRGHHLWACSLRKRVKATKIDARPYFYATDPGDIYRVADGFTASEPQGYHCNPDAIESDDEGFHEDCELDAVPELYWPCLFHLMTAGKPKRPYLDVEKEVIAKDGVPSGFCSKALIESIVDVGEQLLRKGNPGIQQVCPSISCATRTTLDKHGTDHIKYSFHVVFHTLMEDEKIGLFPHTSQCKRFALDLQQRLNSISSDYAGVIDDKPYGGATSGDHITQQYRCLGSYKMKGAHPALNSELLHYDLETHTSVSVRTIADSRERMRLFGGGLPQFVEEGAEYSILDYRPMEQTKGKSQIKTKQVKSDNNCIEFLGRLIVPPHLQRKFDCLLDAFITECVRMLKDKGASGSGNLYAKDVKTDWVSRYSVEFSLDLLWCFTRNGNHSSNHTCMAIDFTKGVVSHTCGNAACHSERGRRWKELDSTQYPHELLQQMMDMITLNISDIDEGNVELASTKNIHIPNHHHQQDAQDHSFGTTFNVAVTVDCKESASLFRFCSTKGAMPQIVQMVERLRPVWIKGGLLCIRSTPSYQRKHSPLERQTTDECMIVVDMATQKKVSRATWMQFEADEIVNLSVITIYTAPGVSESFDCVYLGSYLGVSLKNMAGCRPRTNKQGLRESFDGGKAKNPPIFRFTGLNILGLYLSACGIIKHNVTATMSQKEMILSALLSHDSIRWEQEIVQPSNAMTQRIIQGVNLQRVREWSQYWVGSLLKHLSSQIARLL